MSGNISRWNGRAGHGGRDLTAPGGGEARPAQMGLAPRELASVAGTMVPARRGSVLVLVVGVLALLAIVIVVYTTIGQSDRRGGAAVARSASLDSQSRSIGEYIAQTIGDSTLRTIVQSTARDGNQRVVRVQRHAADIPGVDPVRLSSRVGALANTNATPRWDSQKFSPIGAIETPWFINNAPDPRSATSPWLSSGPAGVVNPSFVQGVNNNDRGAPDQPTNRPWLLAADMAAMSALNPDGRAVNLFGLRNNFAARSGFGFDNVNGRQVPRLSEGLTLLTRVPRGAGADYLVQLPGNQQIKADGTLADPNRPADWFTNQVGIAQPVDSVALNTAGTAATPSDPWALSYQYADAIGNGLFNARWIDLTDASDPNNPRAVVPQVEGYRVFAAIHVEDLSGKVNANTAMTNRTEPQRSYPIGLTPADVDLERMLTMRDVYDPTSEFRGFGLDYLTPPVDGEGRVREWRPGDSQRDVSNYASRVGYVPVVNEYVGRSAFVGVITARALGQPPSLNGTRNDYDSVWNLSREPEIPAARFQRTINNVLFTRLDAEARGRDYFEAGRNPGGATFDPLLQGANTAQTSFKVPGGFGLGDELKLRAGQGAADASEPSRLEAATTGQLAEAPHLDPLRHNRPFLLENLGRDRGSFQLNTGNLQSLQPDGVRDEDAFLQGVIDTRQWLTLHSGARPLQTGYLGDAVLQTNLPSFAPTTALLASEVRLDLNRLVERTNMAARPQSVNTLTPDLAYTEFQRAANELFVAVSLSLAPALGEPNAGATNRGVWDSGNVQTRVRPLFYGGLREAGNSARPFAGSAAESAVRRAAHLTANLLDWRESLVRTGQPGDAPVQFTVLLDENYRNRLTSGGSLDDAELAMATPWRARRSITRSVRSDDVAPPTGTAAEFERSAGVRFAGQFDLNFGRTLTGANAVPSYLDLGRTGQFESRAVTVFGIKPQPFITQVAVLTIYTDAPLSAGGDGQGTEYTIETREIPDPNTGGTQTIRVVVPGSLTVRGDVAESNSDYIGEIAAVQLHNPFDVPIALSSLDSRNNAGGQANVPNPDTQGAELRYYLEFGGRFFALARGSTDSSNTALQPVVLGPRQTVNAYIIDNTFEDIATRLNRCRMPYNATVITADDAREVVENAIRIRTASTPGAPTVAPVLLRAINPATMAVQPLEDGTGGTRKLGVLAREGQGTVGARARYEAVGLPGSDLGTGEAERDREVNRVVRLWRVNRGDTQIGAVQTERGGPNSVLNDQLVDRLRDPATGDTVSLENKLPDGENIIPQSNGQIYADPTDPDFGTIDRPSDAADRRRNNEGITFMRWATIRRPKSTEQTPPGALPVYCMEVKASLGNERAEGVVSLNKVDRDSTATDGVPNFRDIQRQMAYATSVNQFIDTFKVRAPRQLDPLIGRPPNLQTGNELPNSGRNLSGRQLVETNPYQSMWVQVPYARPPLENIGEAEPAGGTNSDPLVREREGDANVRALRAKLAPPLRTADLLAVPAFGPSYEADASTGSFFDPRALDRRWTTLSEALALAMDYDSPRDAQHPDYRLGAAERRDTSGDLGPNDVMGALRHGVLRTDAFVPFEDIDGDGLYTPPGNFSRQATGTGSQDVFPQAGDRVRGLGLPVALNLLERFRTLRYGDGANLTHGVINLNTAGMMVLRSLPMLTPDSESFLTAPPGSATENGRARRVGANTNQWLFDPSVTNPLVWDLAATVKAYRDKSPVGTRLAGINAGNSPTRRVSFGDDVDTAVNPNAPDLRGRQLVTGIAGLREQRGLVSPAELLAIRLRDDAPDGALQNVSVSGQVSQLNGTARTTALRDLSMDRFARPLNAAQPNENLLDLEVLLPGNTQRQPVTGLKTMLYAKNAPQWPPLDRGQQLPAPGSTNDPRPERGDGIVDGPFQQVAIANAVLNTVSTRSDMFGVWFVMRGYTAADVEVDANDPMLPSVERRYFMMVDRSNVTRRGDKPRIVMFEELPTR